MNWSRLSPFRYLSLAMRSYPSKAWCFLFSANVLMCFMSYKTGGMNFSNAELILENL